MKRPICPNCQKEMVFACILISDEFFSAYLCDCAPQPKRYPVHVAADIRQARSEGSDVSYVYKVLGMWPLMLMFMARDHLHKLIHGNLSPN